MNGKNLLNYQHISKDNNHISVSYDIIYRLKYKHGFTRQLWTINKITISNTGSYSFVGTNGVTESLKERGFSKLKKFI